MADARLVTHPLFADADPESVNRALDQLPLRRTELATGESLAVQGDPYDALALLVAGRLTATIEDLSGRSLLIETLEAPEILAAPVLFAPTPRIPVTLVTPSTATVFAIKRTDLDRLAVRFPSIYRRLLADAGEKFVFISTKLRLVQFATLRRKIAGYLLSLIREQHGSTALREPDVAREVELPYTRERLAELFGVARPSLSRTLGELVREGAIRVEGSRVGVSSVGLLRAELRGG